MLAFLSPERSLLRRQFVFASCFLVKHTWVGILALFLISCVMLGKTPHLSEPSFPCWEVGIGMAATAKVAVGIQRDHETKAFGGYPNPGHAQLI